MFSSRTNWKLSLNRYTEALTRHQSLGRKLLDLTVSNPTTIGLSYDTDAILAALGDAQSLTYEPLAKGLPKAREAIGRYYHELGVTLDPEQLLLTTSTSEAYTFCFRLLCEPGDEVLVPTPSYPLFEFLADLQDVRLVPYELIYDHGWQIDFLGLEERITDRTRAVIVVHPNNPTGSFVKTHEMAALAALCADRSLAIIADEVFLDYSLADKAQSFTMSNACLTFTMSGLSKISGLPQMKVAWLAVSGPPDLQAEALARLDVIADTYLSMNAPIQHALPVLLEQRRSIQKQLNARVCENLAELDRQLAKQQFVSRLQIEGGWYAILRVPITRTDEELAVELVSHHDVLVQPGHFYDFANDGYLVVSLITPAAMFRQGMTRLLQYVATL